MYNCKEDQSENKKESVLKMSLSRLDYRLMRITEDGY